MGIEWVVDSEEDKEENDTTGKIETRKYLPSKIVYQNIRRLVTKENKEKIGFFVDMGKNENILFMNFTETWYNKEVKGCPKMKGYELYRGDRSHRQGGGTAIYVKSGFDAQKIAEMSSDEVEMVAVFIEKLNILNIVMYKPPSSQGKNFLLILKKVKEILKKQRHQNPQ